MSSVQMPDASSRAFSKAQPPAAAFADDLICPDCGYSLRGLTVARCPECGLTLDFIEGGQSTLPWAHRRPGGFWRSYWRTVWLVMFHTKRFCREAYRPVDLRDAQRFRYLSVAIGFGSILLDVVVSYALG